MIKIKKIISDLKVGDRFYTPQNKIEKDRSERSLFIILKAENKMLILGGHLDNTYFLIAKLANNLLFT